MYGLNRFLSKEIRSRKLLITEDVDKLVLKNQLSPSIQEGGLWSTLIKKKIKPVAKSYLRKGFLIYEEMRKYCKCSIFNFLIYEENLIFFFISAGMQGRTTAGKKVKNAAKVQ
jgi:hypothetical protein